MFSSVRQQALVAAKIANLPASKHAASIDAAVSQPEAAGMLNVSVKSVKRAKKVQESGDAGDDAIRSADRPEIN